MRVEALLLLGIGVFFGVVGVVYWFWGYEPGGTMMLVGTVTLGLIPGSYYMWWARRMKPRPEDRNDGSLSEGAGVIGRSRARASGRSCSAWGLPRRTRARLRNLAHGPGLRARALGNGRLQRGVQTRRFRLSSVAWGLTCPCLPGEVLTSPPCEVLTSLAV